jgi:poly-gamma-glutamate capsule biosynthesis protein CapA/YwtB (metallophosphatase superfamily)
MTDRIGGDMPEQPLSILVTGDTLPTRPLFRDGAPVRATFGEALDLLEQADVVFGNFEIPLSSRGHPREKLITFRADPGLAGDVGRIGFDVASLANNHILDYGYEALFDTIELLRGQGIRLIGAGHDLAEAVAPTVVEANGWRIGFIAFTCLLPTGAAAAPDRPGLAPIHVHSAYEINAYWQMEEPGEPMVVTPRTWADEADQAFAADCVRRLKQDVDFLCASIHWGYGSGDELAGYQRPLARAILDAGADVILGNHPHAVHGVEVVDGRAILYSPSTFIGQQVREDAPPIALEIWRTMSPDGYLTRLDLEPGGGYGVRIVPISLDDDGLPVVARGDVFDRIAERLARLSAELGTEVEIREDAVVVDARRPAPVAG